jgi:hypothetical protein
MARVTSTDTTVAAAVRACEADMTAALTMTP